MRAPIHASLTPSCYSLERQSTLEQAPLNSWLIEIVRTRCVVHGDLLGRYWLTNSRLLTVRGTQDRAPDVTSSASVKSSCIVMEHLCYSGQIDLISHVPAAMPMDNGLLCREPRLHSGFETQTQRRDLGSRAMLSKKSLPDKIGSQVHAKILRSDWRMSDHEMKLGLIKRELARTPAAGSAPEVNYFVAMAPTPTSPCSSFRQA